MAGNAKYYIKFVIKPPGEKYIWINIQSVFVLLAEYVLNVLNVINVLKTYR